jgi:hypothetical protein
MGRQSVWCGWPVPACLIQQAPQVAHRAGAVMVGSRPTPPGFRLGQLAALLERERLGRCTTATPCRRGQGQYHRGAERPRQCNAFALHLGECSRQSRTASGRPIISAPTV